MRVRGRAGLRAAALLVGIAAFQPGTAQAQDYDTSIGWGGGYLKFAPFVEKGASSPSDIGLGGAPVGLLQVETWRLNRWVGLRLGGFYARGTVSYPTADKDVSSYGIEAAALLRIVPPDPNRYVTAYLIGGGGLIWFPLGEEDRTAPIAGTTVVYDRDEARQWMAVGGAGFEYLPGWRALDGLLGLRFEAIDQIALGRPLRPIDGPEPDMTHNLRFSVTIFSGVPKLF